MDFSRLERNLTDNIKEALLKLGFDSRPMSLNYMNKSLTYLVGEECTEEILVDFAEYVKNRLGRLDFRAIRDGFCITVSAEGTAYVNSLTGYDFMSELVSAVRKHGTTIEQILDIFRRYSGNVTTEEIQSDEADMLVYSDIDEYYYCLTDEGCHVTYHRFIREDYTDLGF